MSVLLGIALAVAITAQPLVSGDVLEPSVQNEVDHALSRVSTNAVSPTAASVAFARLFETNGMDATTRAITLVSWQKDGSWFYCGTNVTPVAVQILRDVSGCASCP